MQRSPEETGDYVRSLRATAEAAHAGRGQLTHWLDAHGSATAGRRSDIVLAVYEAVAEYAAEGLSLVEDGTLVLVEWAVARAVCHHVPLRRETTAAQMKTLNSMGVSEVETSDHVGIPCRDSPDDEYVERDDGDRPPRRVG